MSQSWDLTLYSLVVSATGSGANTSTGRGAAKIGQTWPLTLQLASVDAAGHGSNTSTGRGTAAAVQSWPLTLFDASSARGHGSNTSSGSGSAVGLTIRWYTIDGTVGKIRARPFVAPIDPASVTAPLDLVAVAAPIDPASVTAPLDLVAVFAPLDMTFDPEG